MDKIILLHKNVKDPGILINAFKNNCQVIPYDNTTTVDYVKQYVTPNITHLTLVWENKSKLEHNILPFFRKKIQSNKELNEIDFSLYNNSYSDDLKDLIDYINSQISNNLTLDLLTCDLNDEEFINVTNSLEQEKNINIRYSIDKTGNVGNWILESDNVDVKDIYFNESISNWNHILDYEGSSITNLSFYNSTGFDRAKDNLSFSTGIPTRIANNPNYLVDEDVINFIKDFHNEPTNYEHWSGTTGKFIEDIELYRFWKHVNNDGSGLPRGTGVGSLFVNGTTSHGIFTYVVIFNKVNETTFYMDTGYWTNSSKTSWRRATSGSISASSSPTWTVRGWRGSNISSSDIYGGIPSNSTLLYSTDTAFDHVKDQNTGNKFEERTTLFHNNYSVDSNGDLSGANVVKLLMTIASTTSGVTTGSTTNDASIALTFTSEETTTDFVSGDITVTNGSISNFAGSGKDYTATFTPTGDGLCTIKVLAGKFTDAIGNDNIASDTFEWTYDGTAPTIAISSGDVVNGATSSKATFSFSLEVSEDNTNFAESDITVTNGTLSNFLPSSSTIYDVSFTPTGDGECTIKVEAATFTDAVGNDNTASSTFTWTSDTTGPTITISSTTAGVTTGSTTNDASIALTFTSTENLSGDGLQSSNITVSNGTLSDLSGSGTIYTATFTPTDDGLCSISIGADEVTDNVNNPNVASSTFEWTYDSTEPTMDISSTFASGSTTNDQTIVLTFTSSENTTNFALDDITDVSNGSLSNFTAVSGKVYTATFTPTADGLCSIQVPAGKFTDGAGNSSGISNIFTWTRDTVKPVVTITTSTAGVTSGSEDKVDDDTIDFIFTFTDKNPQSFEAGDITVENGTISNFTGSGDEYKAVFTSTNNGACTVKVAAAAVQDSLGNTNDESNVFSWTFDKKGSIAKKLGITSAKRSAIKTATFTNDGTRGAKPAAAAINAILSSVTGTRKDKSKKRKAAIDLLFTASAAASIEKIIIPKAKLDLPNSFTKETVIIAKPNTTMSIADLSDNDGFYTVLDNGQTFTIDLYNTKATFTRADNGAAEEYTLDLSGDLWGDLGVKKIKGCASFDFTTLANGNSNRLVPDDVIGIDGRQIFIGSIGDGGSEIYTGGDPYISPIYGKTYKMPVDNNIYRMYDNNCETDRFLINVRMKKLDKDYADKLNRQFQRLMGRYNSNNNIFCEEMSFMTQVYIQCGNQAMVYDLEKWKLMDKTDNCNAVIEDIDVNRRTIEEYQNEKRVTRRVKFSTKTMGNFYVYFEKYENPQIRSGLNVSQNTNTRDFVGALIRCSKPESIRVNSLVSREMLSSEALYEYNSNNISIEYFGNIKTGKQGLKVFK